MRVTLTNPAGTLWQGAGQLLHDGQTLGQLKWQLTPSSLLTGKAGADIDLALSAPKGGAGGGELTGNVGANASQVQLDLAGTVTGNWVSQWLKQYEVSLDGEFTTSNLVAQLDPNEAQQTLAANGDIRWSGGLVSYQLGNTMARQRLGPMNAVITGNIGDPEGLSAEVFGQESYPLLELIGLPNGHIKVSITQRLTQLVGSPWPGSEPDHAFVLVVEQPVF